MKQLALRFSLVTYVFACVSLFLVSVATVAVSQVAMETGIAWNDFLLRYSTTLRRIQEIYGVLNPTLQFSLKDVEKFLYKNASE